MEGLGIMMPRESLTTDDPINANQTANPWLQVRGDAYVIASLDLAAFVETDSLRTLNQVRGHPYFDRFLEGLKDRLAGDLFEPSTEYIAREALGYSLGIFNRALAEDSFPPTYKLRKHDMRFPPHLLDNIQFKDRFLSVWNKWEYHIRISSNGVLTLILRLPIPLYRNIEQVTRDVMGLHGYFDLRSARNKLHELEISTQNLTNIDDHESMVALQSKMQSITNLIEWVRERSMTRLEDDQSPVIWQLAVEVTRCFVEDACQGIFEIPNGVGDIHTICLRKTPRKDSLRESYAVFLFQDVRDRRRMKEFPQGLPPARLGSEAGYLRALSGLLQGVVLRAKSTYIYPAIDSRISDELAKQDLSTWDDELCFITDRAALVYFHNNKPNWDLTFSTRAIRYPDYWMSVMRLFEFAVEVKLMTSLLGEMTSPQHATILLNADPLAKQPEPLTVENLTEDVVNVARLLAHVRGLTIAPIVSAFGPALLKYDHLMMQLGARQVLSNAEASAGELAHLLRRHYDMTLQSEAQRISELALGSSLVLASMSFAVAVLTLPSFLVDLAQTSKLMPSWLHSRLPIIGVVVVSMLLLLSTVALIGGVRILSKLANRRRILRY